MIRPRRRTPLSIALLTAGLLGLCASEARAEGASATRGRVINLVKEPAQRQRLLRFVEHKLARIYEASEDRVATSPSRLQPFNGNRELRQRWDQLGRAALAALREAPQVRLRLVTRRRKDDSSKKSERTLLFELGDGARDLGQLAITRSHDLMQSPWRRVERKTEIGFDHTPFFEKGKEPSFLGEFGQVDAGTGPCTSTRCIVPIGEQKAGGAQPAPRLELPVRPSTLAGLPLLEDNVYPAHIRQRRGDKPLSFAGAKPSKASESPMLQAILDKMPALRWITQRYNPKNALARAKLLGMQHLVGNTGAMLLESGLPAGSTHLWGKEYSMFEPAMRAMAGAGFQIHKASIAADEPRIVELMRKELAGIDHPERIKKPQYLLLDDGGTLLEKVGRMVAKEFPRHAHLLAGVEQTTKGAERLKKLQRQGLLPFYVVNVGGSWAKHEASPIYGYAIGKEATALVNSYARSTGHRLSSAVVLGFGHIGAAVAEALRPFGRVTVHDRSQAKLDKAIERGFAVARSKEQALPLAEVLVSCTGTPDGKPTITTEDLPKMPIRSLLANGGSPGELHLRQAPPTSPQRLGPDTVFTTHLDTGAFADEMTVYSITPRSGVMQQVYAAKNGGVINFPRGAKSYGGSAIPERYIQLDVGLLYLGMIQAMQGGPAELGALAKKPQRELFDFVEAQLRPRGESLRKPRW